MIFNTSQWALFAEYVEAFRSRMSFGETSIRWSPAGWEVCWHNGNLSYRRLIHPSDIACENPEELGDRHALEARESVRRLGREGGTICHS